MNNVRDIYPKEILNVWKKGISMGFWHLFSLANVLKCRVQFIYKKLGNIEVRKQLQRIICPRHALSEIEHCIMCTTTRSDMSVSNWMPNHFVVVIPHVVSSNHGSLTQMIQVMTSKCGST